MSTRQREIAEWAQKTFGDASPYRLAVRAQEECVELLADADAADLTSDPGLADAFAEECADVWICLARVAEAAGVDLESALAEPTRLWGDLRQRVASIHYSLAMVVLSTTLPRPASAFKGTLRVLSIDLRDACAGVGRDLLAAVDAKMLVNRVREWRVGRDGSGYHV